TTFPGVFGNSPAITRLPVKCARDGPTRAFAPRMPGIVWHAPQPYSTIACAPRDGLAPARSSGTLPEPAQPASTGTTTLSNSLLLRARFIMAFVVGVRWATARE